jgi:hypothetical protein
MDIVRMRVLILIPSSSETMYNGNTRNEENDTISSIDVMVMASILRPISVNKYISIKRAIRTKMKQMIVDHFTPLL